MMKLLAIVVLMCSAGPPMRPVMARDQAHYTDLLDGSGAWFSSAGASVGTKSFAGGQSGRVAAKSETNCTSVMMAVTVAIGIGILAVLADVRLESDDDAGAPAMPVVSKAT